MKYLKPFSELELIGKDYFLNKISPILDLKGIKSKLLFNLIAAISNLLTVQLNLNLDEFSICFYPIRDFFIDGIFRKLLEVGMEIQ